jgi:hypothetical protein
MKSWAGGERAVHVVAQSVERRQLDVVVTGLGTGGCRHSGGVTTTGPRVWTRGNAVRSW